MGTNVYASLHAFGVFELSNSAKRRKLVLYTERLKGTFVWLCCAMLNEVPEDHSNALGDLWKVAIFSKFGY